MNIFDIQRFCIQDGPGIRTTVFMKGCSLRCPWCHNPEGILAPPQLLFRMDKCTQCGLCAAVCPQKVHVFREGRHVINREACIACGKCTENCAARALELAGKNLSSDEILRCILRDKLFYVKEGGVTFSGGEPLLQTESLCEILSLCRENGIHTAVETALDVPQKYVQRVMELADLMICDLKSANPGKLAEITRGDPQLVYTNLRKVLDQRAETAWVRTPVIPGFNDNEEDMIQLGRFLRGYSVARVELLPYHDYGRSKYLALGRSYACETLKAPTNAEMDKWRSMLSEILSRRVV